MKLDFEVIDGIAFTYINGVKGTLNQMDVKVLLNYYNTLSFNSKYLESLRITIFNLFVN